MDLVLLLLRLEVMLAVLVLIVLVAVWDLAEGLLLALKLGVVCGGVVVVVPGGRHAGGHLGSGRGVAAVELGSAGLGGWTAGRLCLLRRSRLAGRLAWALLRPADIQSLHWAQWTCKLRAGDPSRRRRLAQ